jgi:hypothetical protein
MFNKVKEIYNDCRKFIIVILNDVKVFYSDTRYKMKHLYETNLNNGLFHLSHGNLWDASFRFKIINKFWSKEIEGSYYFSYCLVLIDKPNDALKLLKKIVDVDERAKNLLSRIENGEKKQILIEYANEVKKNYPDAKIMGFDNNKK